MPISRFYDPVAYKKMHGDRDRYTSELRMFTPPDEISYVNTQVPDRIMPEIPMPRESTQVPDRIMPEIRPEEPVEPLPTPMPQPEPDIQQAKRLDDMPASRWLQFVGQMGDASRGSLMGKRPEDSLQPLTNKLYEGLESGAKNRMARQDEMDERAQNARLNEAKLQREDQRFALDKQAFDLKAGAQQRQAELDAVMNDPNSVPSKTVQGSLKQLGLDVSGMSAAQIQSAMPQLKPLIEMEMEKASKQLELRNRMAVTERETQSDLLKGKTKFEQEKALRELDNASLEKRAASRATTPGVARPITGEQATAFSRYKNLVDSEKTLSALEKAGWEPSAKFNYVLMTTGLPSSESGVVAGMAARKLLSPEDLQVADAARQFLESTGRVESGAAIGANEWKAFAERFIPRSDDPPETIELKRARRQNLIRSQELLAAPAIRADQMNPQDLPDNLPPQIRTEDGLMVDPNTGIITREEDL
jgi:hypothetical protein